MYNSFGNLAEAESNSLDFDLLSNRFQSVAAIQSRRDKAKGNHAEQQRDAGQDESGPCLMYARNSVSPPISGARYSIHHVAPASPSDRISARSCSQSSLRC